MKEKDQVIPELSHSEEKKSIYFYLGPFDLPSMMQILSMEIREDAVVEKTVFIEDEGSLAPDNL